MIGVSILSIPLPRHGSGASSGHFYCSQILIGDHQANAADGAKAPRNAEALHSKSVDVAFEAEEV